MRAAIYLRQSQDRTGEQLGVERQREEVDRLISSRGWTMVEVFTDNDVSATSRKPRPQFNEMMSRVDAGEFDVICARHMDRLLRRLSEFVSVLDRCQAAGVAIVTAADGVDTSTDGGRLVARILASVAEGEVERKAARQRSAATQAANRGRWTGGKRPFGYITPTMDLNHGEALHIRAAYTDVIAGKSLAGIAKQWNEAGVTTAEGNKWNGQLIRQILLKPRYAGLRSHHGEIVAEGAWAAVVSDEIWRIAVAILNRPERRTAQSTACKYLLTGIMLCGRCEAPMRTAIGGQGKPVYRCKKCFGNQRLQEPVNLTVKGLILVFFTSDEGRQLIAKRTATKQVDVRDLLERERALIEGMDEIAISVGDGLLTPRQAKIATDRKQEQLDDIRSQLYVATDRSDALRELFVSADPEKTWDHWDLDRQRRVIREVVELRLDSPGGGQPFHARQLRYRWLLAED